MYYWDEFVGRYRDEKGRFVARDTIYEFVNQSLDASTNISDTLAQLVSDGLMSVEDWYNSMRQEIKDEYIRQYVSFIGGVDRMTQADWGRLGGMIGDQYRYLPGFRDAIASGELTEAQIQARAAMYINSAREAAERAKAIVAKAVGFDTVFWQINPQLENCKDCIEFNMMGEVEVATDPYKGAYPGSGDTVCLTACGCGLIYSNSKTGEEYAY